jgi:hypothetical protein
MNSYAMKSLWRLFFHLLFVGLFSLNFSPNGFAQSQQEVSNYEIVVLGLKIGKLKASKTAGLDTIQYSVESEVKFWFFGDVELQFLTRSSFKQGMVSRTYSHSKTNRGNFVSKVNWKDNAYQVNANSYKYTDKKAVSGPLSWCSSKLFFQEPTGQEIFISEVYGVTAPIRKTGPGEYTVSVEGNTNRYYYRQGKLVKIVVDNPIKNYQVRLAN